MIRSYALILATLMATLTLSAASAQHDHRSHERENPASRAEAPSGSESVRAREMGQSAFAAISEVVAILESDPSTDWGRVDLLALREHLVDMERLTIETVVLQRPVDQGVEIIVGGPAAAVDAARRMVPPHVAMVARGRGWKVDVEDRGADLRILWTTNDEEEVERLRALGFFGLMAEGGHHQHHHLMIAAGRSPH